MRKRQRRGKPLTGDQPPRRRTVLLAAVRWEPEGLKPGIVRYARRQGWHLLDLEYYNTELPRSFRPDGVLFLLPSDQQPLARRLLRLGVPVVQVQDYVRRVQAPRVVQDRLAIGDMAADHFLARGFRALAYLRHNPWAQPNAKLTLQGFANRAREGGAEARDFWLQRDGAPLSWEHFAQYTRRFAEEMEKFSFPLGILTYNDKMAVRVCHMCKALGLLVPEQVAVMGIGNDALHCECASVPLSSVDVDAEGQGWRAAELLDELMAGVAGPAEEVLIAPKAVASRQSTDIFALPDANVARALHYMWDHFTEELTVSEIAWAARISRRKLEMHFRKYLGRTVNQELTRKRLERCCELLVGTNDTIAAIARRAGYPTESYLYRLFRSAFGQTPRQYRLAARERD